MTQTEDIHATAGLFLKHGKPHHALAAVFVLALSRRSIALAIGAVVLSFVRRAL